MEDTAWLRTAARFWAGAKDDEALDEVRRIAADTGTALPEPRPGARSEAERHVSMRDLDDAGLEVGWADEMADLRSAAGQMARQYSELQALRDVEAILRRAMGQMPRSCYNQLQAALRRVTASRLGPTWGRSREWEVGRVQGLRDAAGIAERRAGELRRRGLEREAEEVEHVAGLALTVAEEAEGGLRMRHGW